MEWRKIYCLAGILLLPTLTACSQGASDTPTKAEAPVDPRIAELASITDLPLAKEKCQGTSPYGTGSDEAFSQACRERLSALILAQEIPTFEEGLRYLNRELQDGKITTVSASAAQQALQNWLRLNASDVPADTLFRWRDDLLPAEDEAYVFMTIRSLINDELRKRQR